LGSRSFSGRLWQNGSNQMPLYPFKCDADSCGREIEKLMFLREYEAGDKPECPDCHGSMHRIHTARGRNANAFQAIVLHKGPDGSYSFPMNEHAPVPEGYEKLELTTFADVDRHMRSINAVERRKMEAHVEEQRLWLNHIESTNRAELRDRMRHMQPAARAFAELAMRHNDAKPRPKEVDPNVFVEVRERDSSNRESYVDRETAWKRRRG
jgi:predicted nucleic acid-binding Zn ribbon protein